MSQHDQEIFEETCQHARQTALLSSVQELLGWDERTMMPPTAAPYRAEQAACLAGMAHQRTADPRYGEALEALAASPLASPGDSDSGTTIRRLRREHQKAVKVPQSLVEEIARAAVMGQNAWTEARQKNDFPTFLPFLERMLHLKRQQAEALGYSQSPYDALLDDYEPEAVSTHISQVLAGLREELVPLVAAIGASRRQADRTILARHYPIEVQEALGREAAAKIGFDFTRGRLDPTVHPFCASMGPSDCRITTRYNPWFFNEAFFGILHEAGHGIYDQGLCADQYGLPPGQPASLGIHESQSRFWENIVGRSRAFWQHFFPKAQRQFPAALEGVPLDDFYFAVNDVQPSLIRVEADEATYNLHILIRFELETALIADQLRPADLPGVWADCYEKYLGIRPANDREGVLQDVHWSAGLIGYFPTYALGNLCAAQLAAQADKDLGGLARLIVQGEFVPIREWLALHVHQQGQRYCTEDLILRATGQRLSHQPLMAYLRAKLGPLYGV